MPGILFENGENLEFGMKFNQIWQNIEFYVFTISYNPKPFFLRSFFRIEI